MASPGFYGPGRPWPNFLGASDAAPDRNLGLSLTVDRPNVLKRGLQTGGHASEGNDGDLPPEKGERAAACEDNQNLIRRSSSLTRPKILALVVRVVMFSPKPSQQKDATTLPCKMARRRLDSTDPVFWAAR